jgi:hypothetical protein
VRRNLGLEDTIPLGLQQHLPYRLCGLWPGMEYPKYMEIGSWPWPELFALLLSGFSFCAPSISAFQHFSVSAFPPMNAPDQFLLYTAPDGAVKVDVFFQNETVWLTQKALAELFGVQRPAITKHLGNIFETGELAENSVCSILEHIAADGKKYSAKYYNLDAIIAVGYRVNSYQAPQFRIWATKTLCEFIIKGIVMEDERLKQGKHVFAKDYFDELRPGAARKLVTNCHQLRTGSRSVSQLVTNRHQLTDLFQRDKSVISRHIKNVFDEGELRPEGTVAKSATVQTVGSKQVTREK